MQSRAVRGLVPCQRPYPPAELGKRTPITAQRPGRPCDDHSRRLACRARRRCQPLRSGPAISSVRSFECQLKATPVRRNLRPRAAAHRTPRRWPAVQAADPLRKPPATTRGPGAGDPRGIRGADYRQYESCRFRAGKRGRAAWFTWSDTRNRIVTRSSARTPGSCRHGATTQKGRKNRVQSEAGDNG